MPTPAAADINYDGRIDEQDLTIVVTRLFDPTDTPKNPNPDVNRDGRITAADVVSVLRQIR